jgi:hypothetical protein
MVPRLGLTHDLGNRHPIRAPFHRERGVETWNQEDTATLAALPEGFFAREKRIARPIMLISCCSPLPA